ncbi:hypothetical protein [Burkholderia orbicola]|uniref:hypothetical protein n=1 Tax=Burkholderia orbicola TaxID=2978683 RepID=UPI0039A5E313
MQEIVRPQPPQIASTKLPVRHPARVWLAQTARLYRMGACTPTTAETRRAVRQIAACTGVSGTGRDGTSRMKVQKNAARSERLGEKAGRGRDCPASGRTRAVQPSGTVVNPCGGASVTGMPARAPGVRRRGVKEVE